MCSSEETRQTDIFKHCCFSINENVPSSFIVFLNLFSIYELFSLHGMYKNAAVQKQDVQNFEQDVQKL